MMIKLPAFLLVDLASPPQTGEGVHQWLYRTARNLHAHMAGDQIYELLRGKVENCGRPVPDLEIWDAIQNSKGTAWRPGARSAVVRHHPAWPDPDNALIREIVETSQLEIADLWERSPIRLADSGSPATEELIDILFPPDCLLCVGRSASDFKTKQREELRGRLERHQLIVPSPMTSTKGRRKKDGQLSAHTLANTGPRRFLVVEFDKGSPDTHANFLWHLAMSAPLIMVLHSGGKSLHGWFWCGGQTERRLKSFMRGCVRLGADPATWGRSQFVRMPDAMRDNDNRQSVLFFNPNPINKP